MDRAFPGEGWRHEAVGQFRVAAANALRASDQSLYFGRAGLQWVSRQLRLPKNDWRSVTTIEINESEGGLRQLGPKFDLLGGAVGIGVGALEPPRCPSDDQALQEILRLLSERAELRPEGIAWRTDAQTLPAISRKLLPTGELNLGLAHGTPGVVVLLAALHRHGVGGPLVTALLHEASAWLMAQAEPTEETESSWYQYRVTNEATRSEPARLAWCYGDLSVSAALVQAAAAMEDAATGTFALDLARHAARRSITASRVVDSAFCHGSAGVMHMLSRLSQATGDRSLGEAADRWLEHLLGKADPSRPLCGFRTYSQNGWTSDPSFVGGAVGIGLALLAATNDASPEWDRAFLLSIATAEEPDSDEH
jgi:hypothetical protein